jgi:hypothetical protein
MNEQNLSKLRELLLNEFTEEQLAELSRDIGINYSELGGVGTFGKSREIVEVARSRHLLPALSARVRDLRPEAYRAAKITDAGTASEPAQTISGDTGTDASAAAAASTAASTVPAPRRVGDSPAAEGEASRATTTPTSVLSGPVRATLVIIGALLLIVALLTIIFRRPAAAPPAATSAPTTAPTTPSSATNAQAAAPVTATLGVTAAVQASPTGAAQDTPAAATKPSAVESTPTVSETHPAAQAVHNINDELLAFYQGKATSEELKQHWRGNAYDTLITFAYTTLKRKLGVDLTQSDPLTVTLRYVRRPTLVRQSGNSFRVSTREYWGYTNTSTKRSICETRDYTYTMVKNGNDYQVTDLTGNLISANCQE